MARNAKETLTGLLVSFNVWSRRKLRMSSAGHRTATVKIVELDANQCHWLCAVQAASGDLVAPAPLRRRHAGARRWRHVDLAVTPRARERHAPARAGCVITVLPLARAAKPPAPIGHPPPLHPTIACLVPRALAERFIRLPPANRTTRLPTAEARSENTSFVN